VREGWEGLVLGNSAPEPEGDFPHAGAPEAPTPLPDRRRGGFVSTYGEGELLKEGEGEQTLKGRYIIRVSHRDQSSQAERTRLTVYVGVGDRLGGTTCAGLPAWEEH